MNIVVRQRTLVDQWKKPAFLIAMMERDLITQCFHHLLAKAAVDIIREPIGDALQPVAYLALNSVLIFDEIEPIAAQPLGLRFALFLSDHHIRP
jgi:hypothetical protein